MLATRQQRALLSFEIIKEFQAQAVLCCSGGDARFLELLGQADLIENAGPRTRTLTRSLCDAIIQRIGMESHIAGIRQNLDRLSADLARQDGRLVVVNQEIDAVKALLAP